MRRLKSSTICCGVVLLIAAAIGWWTYAAFAMPAVHPHSGDGQFEDISWRFPWQTIGLPLPGYTITFEHFDLGTNYEASLEVKNLPTFGKEVGVYLCVHDPQHAYESDEQRHKLNATVELEVDDGAGRTVCYVKQLLAKMYWASPQGGADTYGLYDLDESFFWPQSNERYRIRVHYEADPNLSGLEGFVFIRCGGSA